MDEIQIQHGPSLDAGLINTIAQSADNKVPEALNSTATVARNKLTSFGNLRKLLHQDSEALFNSSNSMNTETSRLQFVPADDKDTKVDKIEDKRAAWQSLANIFEIARRNPWIHALLETSKAISNVLLHYKIMADHKKDFGLAKRIRDMIPYFSIKPMTT